MNRRAAARSSSMSGDDVHLIASTDTGDIAYCD
jgi:hypothetical protein